MQSVSKTITSVILGVAITRGDFKDVYKRQGSAWRVKQICLPSGDQESGEDGEEASAVFDKLHAPEVRRFAAPPEAETSQMCEGVGAAVSRNELSPTSKRSWCFSMSAWLDGSSGETKAMRAPSGRQAN